MTINQSLYFTYDSINSYTEFGIMNVSIQPGMYSESFVASRSLKEIKIRGKDGSYLQDIEKQNLKFTLTFAFEDKFDKDKLRAVARWLTSPTYYRPLIFHDTQEPDGSESMVYAIFAEDFNIVHTGLQTGYLQVTALTSSPYWYSPVYLSSTERVHNYFLSPTMPYEPWQTITFTNNGDEPIRPIIIITPHSSRVKILNTTNGGQLIRFTGLKGNGETVEVDCQEELVSTDLPDTYRYNNLSDDSRTDFELVPGVNTLKICGDFELQFKWEEKLLAHY